MMNLARWSMDHRRVVIVAWLLLLLAGMGLSKTVGNHFDNSATLPHSDSQAAADLLTRRFPSQAGDVDQIVVATRAGRIDDAVVRSAVTTMLGRVEQLPHVVSVTSPYDARRPADAISGDGTIAFATVTFDEQGDSLPTTAIERVVHTAQAIRSSRLDVELNGNAIEQLQRPSPGAATAVGIAAAVVVLLLSFGSLLAMGLPILTAVAGLGVGSGLIAVLTQLIAVPDFAEQLAMMIGLGVGIDYALLLVTRFRDAYRHNSGDLRAAVEVAMATAGRSIAFAGVTVVIALAGLLAVGTAGFSGVALAASSTVLLMLASSLTLLPAVLSLAGRRLGEGARRRQRRRQRPGPSRSERWVAAIQRRPVVAAVAATALLLTLAAPALDLRLALNDASSDQPSTTTKKAYDLLARGFKPGFNGPLTVAVDLPDAGRAAALDRIASAIRRTPNVAEVAPARFNAGRDTASLVVIPQTAPVSPETDELVRRLRASVLPAATAGTEVRAHVGGFTARGIDFTQRLSDKLPVFMGLVIALSVLLLLGVFRSLLIPLQAALMNLLSIGASLGIIQALFERGWLAGLLGIQQAPIPPFIPVITFAIVFGLSMDYEVFLVSRVQEEWHAHGDHTAAVRNGLARTSRVITAAAAVMVLVFTSFALGGVHVLQVFGIALASAILLDALVIRMILLPAVLQLMGPATWRLPRSLDRLLPRVRLEAPTELEPHPPMADAAAGLQPATASGEVAR